MGWIWVCAKRALPRRFFFFLLSGWIHEVMLFCTWFVVFFILDCME